MKVLKSFIKEKETLLGIVAAIAFQLIFVVVWLTGYDGVYNRIDQFSIGVVNKDQMLGKEIINEIKDRDLFQLIEFDELTKANQQLDNRDVNMVIQIPDNVIERLQKREQVAIDYYINQSAPTLTKQMMETIADTLNEQVNEKLGKVIDSQIAENIPPMVAAQIPNEEMKVMTEEVARQVVDLVQENTQTNPMFANVIKTNEKEGFAITMVPLLIVLASYISAMLISQYLQLVNGKLIKEYNRFTLFLGRQMINVLSAIGISFLTVSLIYLFNIELTHSFFVVWGIQFVLLFSFLAISQVFVMLFGNPGMIFNIALTATQLVSSGAIVPRELLPSFYYELGKFLPATYGVNSYYSLIYGGGDLKGDLANLGMLIAGLIMIALFVQVVFYWIDQFKKKKISNDNEHNTLVKSSKKQNIRVT